MITSLLFGIELEGSFDERLWDWRPSKYVNYLKRDGSLTCSKAGELTTIPFIDTELFRKTLEDIAPYYLGFNDSCGFHIHLSVPLATAYQMKPEELENPPVNKELTFQLQQFFDYPENYRLFIRYLVKRFPEIENRLKNRYCKYRTLRELIEKGYTRYQAINYSSLRGTVEVRIFPANTLERCYEYTIATIRWIERNWKEMELLFSIIF